MDTSPGSASQNKLNIDPLNNNEQVKHMGSLTRQTLIKTALSIGVVIIGSTAIGYFQLVSRFTSETLKEVENSVQLRAMRESNIFSMAEDNHKILKQALLDRIKSDGNLDPEVDFRHRLKQHKDGSIRNNSALFNFKKTPGIFLGSNVKIDSDMRRRVIAYQDLLQAYGPAWYNRYFNTYIQIPENGLVVYMPDNNWTQNAPSDPAFRVTADESFYITDKTHDPKRETVWTGIYYDAVMKNWMAGCMTPVDVNGRHIATLGHDILISDLQNRTINESLEGTYNMIFRADGRLVAHPKLMDQIKKSEGKLNISQSEDTHLRKIFDLVSHGTKNNKVILEDARNNEYLAVTKIDGPDWYFVTVLPKAVLQQKAFSTAWVILVLGLVSLLIEIGIVYYILNRQLSAPLTNLMTATENIAAGNLDIKLDENRQDELGRLAYLFNKMALQLQESFAKLGRTNEELELRVGERTSELNAAKELADSANHAKSEFLANMSHELRTPLNGILGYAQILKQSNQLAEPEQKGVNIIHQCGSHLLTLINDILDLSKIEAQKMDLHFTELHFPSFLEGVTEICRIKAEQKGIEFIYQPDGLLPIGIKSDEKRLRQVLINLLSNAIKFTEKGSVTFLVKNQILECTNTPDGIIHRLCFQVEDTGIGIKKENLEKIFLPFEQVGSVQKQAEGTGLGLAISQKIANMMGGSLNVKSKLEKGSIFWLEINVSESSEWTDISKESSPGRIIGFKEAKQKILIVDDRWENRSVIANLLEPIGFEIIESEDGQEGLDKAHELEPDLIICDLAMPILDGHEMIKELRQNTLFENIPIIVSSASVFETDRQKSIDAGANFFLPKPIQSDILLNSMQQLLGLEWIYEIPKESSQIYDPNSLDIKCSGLVLPSIEDLNLLYDLSRKGLIHNLNQEIERIEREDRQLIPFVKEIRQLVKSYQLTKIRIFIEPYLDQKDSKNESTSDENSISLESLRSTR
jgi:signal transduction histidine kinase/ActR/RegA family two-component response regulator